MFGQSSGKVRAKFGQCSGKVRAKFGQSLGKVWAKFGQSSGNVRAKFGQSSGNVRTKFGQSSGKVRAMFEQSSGNVRAKFGQCSGKVRAKFGQSSGNVRAKFGQSLGKVWAKFGQSLGKVWAKFGQCSGKVRAKFGQCSDKVRAKFGQSSGKVQAKFGQCSDKVRAKFGQCSGKVRAMFGQSSGKVRAMFGQSSGKVRAMFGQSSGKVRAKSEDDISRRASMCNSYTREYLLNINERDGWQYKDSNRFKDNLQVLVLPILVYIMCRSMWIRRLDCHDGCQEVKRCCTRGESEESLHSCDKTRKWTIHSGIETQGRHHQKSKTRVSVALQKGLMSSKFLLKKIRMQSSRMHTTYFGGHHKMSVPGGSASEMSASSERSPGRPPRWTDKHLWKHYLPATPLVSSNNLRQYPPFRSRMSCIQPQSPQPPRRNPPQRCARRPGPLPPRGRRPGQPGTSYCPC